ncbi:hypothetical protein HY642_01815 [Candidatus Woesearchaeota archaeon]|nr:hypothetical protein [Candidatus Woesearchaeota archaeon]
MMQAILVAALSGLAAALFRCRADPDAAKAGRLPVNPWLVNSLAGLLAGSLAVFWAESVPGVAVLGAMLGYVGSDVIDSLVFIVWRWVRG